MKLIKKSKLSAISFLLFVIYTWFTSIALFQMLTSRKCKFNWIYVWKKGPTPLSCFLSYEGENHIFDQFIKKITTPRFSLSRHWVHFIPCLEGFKCKMTGPGAKHGWFNLKKMDSLDWLDFMWKWLLVPAGCQPPDYHRWLLSPQQLPPEADYSKMDQESTGRPKESQHNLNSQCYPSAKNDTGMAGHRSWSRWHDSTRHLMNDSHDRSRKIVKALLQISGVPELRHKFCKRNDWK